MADTKSIVQLGELVQALPEPQRERFQRIFRVDSTTGELRAPQSMHDWIEGHFGSLEAVRQQHIVKVTNLITVEGALFNELRARRPLPVVEKADLNKTIVSHVGGPFCHPLEETSEDVFGRVKGKYCVTASNVAKYDGFSGVVVFDEHNPLVFSHEQVTDYLDTALAWARQAHCVDKDAVYFFLLWNCLWKSGASVLHGHAQMSLGRGIHYAKVERLRRAALLYRLGHGANYFDDLYDVHKALGLAVDYRHVCILAYLTPTKDKEVILLAPRLDDDTKRVIYKVLRCFIDQLGVRSFNLALHMRPIDGVPEDWKGFPAQVRIVDRGDPHERSCDVGGMDLYGSSVIASDPFHVAEALASALQGDD
jgi:hypothetical protein